MPEKVAAPELTFTKVALRLEIFGVSYPDKLFAKNNLPLLLSSPLDFNGTLSNGVLAVTLSRAI